MTEQCKTPTKQEKPPLVLIPAKTLSRWQERVDGVWAIVERISSCPVYEVRLEAAKQLRYAEINNQATAEEVIRLHRALLVAKEDNVSREILHGFLDRAKGGAFAPAVEYALTYDGMSGARYLSKDICYKLVHGWYNLDLFVAMPSLKGCLEYLLSGLDCQILRDKDEKFVNQYDESCWVNARRAMQVLVSFAPACESFLPLLVEIQRLMKEKLIIPSNDSFSNERNTRKVRAMHLLEMRYTIADIKAAIIRQKREQLQEAV